MSMGASPPGTGRGTGMEEYQRLMVERAAAAKRKRTLFLAVLVVALGAGGFWWKQQRNKADAAQAVLDAAGRFAERDKMEMGAFWNCTLGSEVDVGQFSNASQIQQRVEAAYFHAAEDLLRAPDDGVRAEDRARAQRPRRARGGHARRAQATPREVRRDVAPHADGHRGVRRDDQGPRRRQGRRPIDPGRRRGVLARGDGRVDGVREVHGVRHP